MPIYKILGIYSFSNTLREACINDPVVLKHEKYNIKSKNAITRFHQEYLKAIIPNYSKSNPHQAQTKEFLNEFQKAIKSFVKNAPNTFKMVFIFSDQNENKGFIERVFSGEVLR